MKVFYIKHFEQNGWEMVEDSFGLTSEWIQFRKGNYDVSVTYSKKGDGVNYIFSCEKLGRNRCHFCDSAILQRTMIMRAVLVLLNDRSRQLKCVLFGEAKACKPIGLFLHQPRQVDDVGQGVVDEIFGPDAVPPPIEFCPL